MKNKNFMTVFKYTAIIFASMVFYCVLNCFQMIETGLYSLFIGDFSIGFCSRLFIGSILSLFKDSFTKEWMTSFLRIITFIVFMISAHFIASSLSRAKQTDKKTLAFFACIFVFSPFSVTIYAGDIFGFIDIFCYIVLLITIYAGNNKFLFPLVPVFLASGIFIHDAFITGYMAPCLAIVAYYAVKKYGTTIRAGISFTSSSVVCVGTCIYTVFFANSTIKMTESEVLNYLAKKGNCSVEDVSGYIEGFLFYKDTRDVSESKEYADNIGDFVIHMFKLAIESLTPTYVLYFVSIIPILVLIFYVWAKSISNCNTFAEKIPYILFMLTPVPQLISLLMSTDFTRFLATIVITQLCYLFICIKQKDKNIIPAMEYLNNNKKVFIIPCMSTILVNMH